MFSPENPTKRGLTCGVRVLINEGNSFIGAGDFSARGRLDGGFAGLGRGSTVAEGLKHRLRGRTLRELLVRTDTIDLMHSNTHLQNKAQNIEIFTSHHGFWGFGGVARSYFETQTWKTSTKNVLVAIHKIFTFNIISSILEDFGGLWDSKPGKQARKMYRSTEASAAARFASFLLGPMLLTWCKPTLTWETSMKHLLYMALIWSVKSFALQPCWRVFVLL